MSAFYEMTTIANTSVMINVDAVESVVEHEQFVEITMLSGVKHNLIPQTFFVALNNKEVPYMKFDRKEDSQVAYNDLPDAEVEDLVE